MKLTAVLLLIAGLHVSAKTFSQKVTLDLYNVPLQKLFKEIKRQTGCLFLYSNEELRNAGTVSVHVKDATVEQVLAESLSATGLTFRLVNQTIVISPKATPVRAAPLAPPPPPPSDFHGKVTNDKGDPLAGATITIKGTLRATTTNDKGEFTLTGVDPGTVLVISYIGFQATQVKVADQNSIVVHMKPNVTGLNDVVVVGYGTQAKRDLTSAITNVNTQLLDSRSLTNLSSSLEGITPGVFIDQQNGRPGQTGASIFNIRGASLSTFSSNPPLIIIDGVVDDIDDVNPADVDKISILKDAAASAIYGARATGGVVLITTKKGISSGKLTISYNGMTGFQRQPYGDIKFVNTATWMKANNEAAELDGSPDIFSQAQIAPYINSKDPQLPASTQWTSWIAKTAPQQTHNLNLRGGSGPINFYISGGYVTQSGFVQNDGFDRKNVLLNLDYHPVNRLQVSANVAYLRTDQTQAGVNYNGGLFGIVRNAIFTPPNEPLYNRNGTFNNNVIWGSNPVYNEIYGGDALINSDNFRMSINLQYEVLPGLKVDVTTATKLFYSINNTINPRIPYLDSSGNVLGYNVANVSVSENWAKTDYVNNQFLLDYAKKAGLHSISLTGGITYEDELDKYIGAGASQFPNNAIREISGSTGTGSQITGTSSSDQWAINSVIGRLNYAYNDKYLFQGTIRYDGSSRFSPDNRWGLFPSFSGGWRLKEESFLKSVSFLSDLKLRASWGQLGNQGSNLYPYAQSVAFGTTALGNGLVSTAYLGSPVNYNLTWEKQTTENAGLDFGFLNNRLTGSYDHFQERTTNIIGTLPAPSTFGASPPLGNLYTIDNRGFELDLKWNDTWGKVRYFAAFNLSNTVDKVVNLNGLGAAIPGLGKAPAVISSDGNTFIQQGKAQGQWYMIRTDGLFVNQAQIAKSAFQTTLTKPGDIHYLDANGDGIINSDDRVPLGKTTTPHYYFGLNFGVEYDGFDLTAVLNGVWDYWQLKNQGGVYLVGVRPDLDLIQKNYDHRWTTANPNQWAKEPRLTQDNWIGNLSNIFQPSQYQLANFGYLRLKNLQVGYTIPERITRKWNISKVRVYVTTENLFTIKPGYIESIDPESFPGFDSNASAFFGPDKLTSFGVNISL